MAGVKPPLPRAYPALRFATALTTLLLIFTVAINAVATLPLGAAAPVAPGYGMGGGGGGGAEEESAAAPAAEEPAPQEPAAPSEGLQAVPTLAAADTARIGEAATATPQTFMQQQPAPEESVPAAGTPEFSWPLALLILTLLLGAGTWLVRYLNDRTWRGKA
jgi:hypothetical protein